MRLKTFAIIFYMFICTQTIKANLLNQNVSTNYVNDSTIQSNTTQSIRAKLSSKSGYIRHDQAGRKALRAENTQEQPVKIVYYEVDNQLITISHWILGLLVAMVVIFVVCIVIAIIFLVLTNCFRK